MVKNTLVENFRDNNSDVQSELSDNFDVFPPDEVIERFSKVRGNWERILTQILTRANQGGIQLDPETFSFYSQALEKAISSRVGIYVPEISKESHEKIGQELGFLRKGQIVGDIRFLRKSNAFKMLEVDTRKMLLWIKMPNSFTRVLESKEVPDISLQKNELEMISRQLRIQESGSPASSLFLHAHDHPGNINPILAALAMEILLRRHNIPYVVQGVTKQPYHYDTVQKRVLQLT